MFPARFTAKDEYAPDRFTSDIVLNLPAPHQAPPLQQDGETPGWLKCPLNDVGFGILILDPDLNVCFCNDSAKTALDAAGFADLLVGPAETSKEVADSLKGGKVAFAMLF
jgi:hypothetical protein